MKKIFFSAMSLVIMIGATQAQEKGKHRGNDKQEMAQHLNLTEVQKAQLKTLHENQRKEVEALRKNDLLTVRDAKAQRKSIQEKYKTQYQSILTPEQKEKMKAHRQNGPRKGPKGNHKMDKGDVQERAQELNLTQSQKDQLANLRETNKAKAEAIRNNTSLSKEQKRAQFQELMKNQKEQMKSVLTKEQIEKAQSLRNTEKKGNIK